MRLTGPVNPDCAAGAAQAIADVMADDVVGLRLVVVEVAALWDVVAVGLADEMEAEVAALFCPTSEGWSVPHCVQLLELDWATHC